VHTWECQQASQERVERGWLVMSDMKDGAQESMHTWKEIGVPNYILKVESCTQISVKYQSELNALPNLTVTEELVLIPSAHNY
jgi:hypothetical protein